jgi:serine/threonine protein kinase
MGESRNTLPEGFRLHWYEMIRVLGQGGFGITYLAKDTNLDQLVAVKEYLPVDMAIREGDWSVQPFTGERGDNYRWGLERFISEAQTLAKFKHDNIVRVLSVFTENNTAYMVMEYEAGMGFDEKLKQSKKINENEVKGILFPLLDGLEYIHAAGFIHRDIKPPNIYVRKDDSPVLLDFGSARQSLGIQTRTLTTMVSPGYAPFEQYVSKSDKQGPWTDIYGLAATLYRAVTGIAPPNAVDRSEALLHAEKDIYVPASDICAGVYAEEILQAIDHGMAFKTNDRPQDVMQWRNEFQGIGIESRPRPVPAKNEEPVKITMAVSNSPNSEAETEVVTPEAPVKKKKWYKKNRVLIPAFLFLLILLSEEEQSVQDNSDNDADLNSVVIEAIEAPVVDSREVDDNSSSNQESAPVTDPLPETGNYITRDEQQRLAALREKWKNNPDKKATQKEIEANMKELGNKVRAAIREGKGPLARAYIEEALKFDPDNKQLKDLIERLKNEYRDR